MFNYYKQGCKVENIEIPQDISIVKNRPKSFVKNMHSMQMGRRRLVYFEVMSFLNRGFSRTFVEYDMVKNNEIVSKAVLISKVPIYDFLPKKGIHLGYCETILEERGKGYYPLLLKYIQFDNPQEDLFMIVDQANFASIRGVEKAGFEKYAVGFKDNKGRFCEVTE